MNEPMKELFKASDVKLYEGTKRLKAWSLTRGEYNQYRGWEMPHDEDANEPGYLVEYEADGKPNHPAHEGYISWSPAMVFEKSYKYVSPLDQTLPYAWVARLIAEGRELSEKYQKLQAFMQLPAFKALPVEHRYLLGAQSQAMGEYLRILTKRVDRAKLAEIEHAPNGEFKTYDGDNSLNVLTDDTPVEQVFDLNS